jgi:hypothetical protein
MNELEDASTNIETAPSQQLGQLFVLRSFVDPFPARAVAKVGFEFRVRSFVHLLSRSRHRMNHRR